MCFIAGCLTDDKIYYHTAHNRHRVHIVYIFHAKKKSVTTVSNFTSNSHLHGERIMKNICDVYPMKCDKQGTK